MENETLIEIERLYDSSDELDAEAVCPCGFCMCACLICILPDDDQ